MKKQPTLLVILFICTLNYSSWSQIWEPRNANFTLPSQGWSITPTNDSVAWTFGFVMDSSSTWTYNDWTFQKTIDGGLTWTAGVFPSGDGGYLSNIASTNKNRAWIAYNDDSTGSKVFETNDGGQTWKDHQSSLFTTWINSIHFFNENNGIILCDPINGDYVILTTDDGGLTWDQVPSGNLPDVLDNDEFGTSGSFAVSDSTIWFNTFYDRVYYSSDYGHTWDVWDKPTEASGFSLNVTADEEKKFYLTFIDSDNNTFSIFRRNVQDSIWTNLTPADNEGFIPGICAIPGTGNLIMNISPSRETKVSYDQGNNWITIDTNYEKGFISFYDANTGYSCELKNTYDDPSQYVFTYVGSPILGLINNKKIDVNLTLSPNPATQLITINLKVPAEDDFWILINDIEGKLIRKLTLTNTSTFNTSLDIQNLKPGIYTVTIATSSGRHTEKFIKIE